MEKKKSVLLDADLHKEVKVIASKNGQSISSFIREALEDAFDKNGK